MPPRSLRKTSVPNPSSNQRRVRVTRDPAYYDGVSVVRVKLGFETLAAGSFAQADSALLERELLGIAGSIAY